MLYAKTELVYSWLAGNNMYMYAVAIVKAVNVIYEPVTELFICFRKSKENLSQAVEVLLLYGRRKNSLDI